ncbi:hypothetical protein ASD01_17005 [Ensifer sp. Root423]|nr:hypothetical protein ASD01_17005 [Ensifer sp. Root423]
MKKRSTFIVIQLHRSAANQVGLRKLRADRARQPLAGGHSTNRRPYRTRIQAALVPCGPATAASAPPNNAFAMEGHHSIPIGPRAPAA